QIAEIRDLIINIGKERTVLLSTHIMQEVQAMCNRVIIINNGQIVADDSIENIQNSKEDIQTTTLWVEFEKPINEAAFKNMKFVKNIELPNEKTCLLQTEQPEQLRKEI